MLLLRPNAGLHNFNAQDVEETFRLTQRTI